MKLKDLLKKYKNKQVKLGSKTAFVYCEIVNGDIIDNLLFLSDKELEKLHELRAKYIKHMETFELYWSIRIQNKIDNFIQEMKEVCLNKNKKFRLSDYKKPIELLSKKLEDAKEDDFKTTQRNLNQYTKRIKEFTPFAEREVLEVYDSIYDKDTIIIKFEGEDEGDFWFRKEFVNVWGGLVDKRQIKRNTKTRLSY